MRLPDTPKMKKLWDEIEPFRSEKGPGLVENAPEEVKKALENYRKLAKEQYDFAMSLM